MEVRLKSLIVIPSTSKNIGKAVCKKCYFFKGKNNQRNCPIVRYNVGSKTYNTKLCAIIGNGYSTYFVKKKAI